MFYKLVAVEGFEPSASQSPDQTVSPQNCAKAKQINALKPSDKSGKKQNLALSAHNQDTSAHSKRVPEEYQLPPDLAHIVSNWDRLSKETKGRIMAIVQETAGS